MIAYREFLRLHLIWFILYYLVCIGFILLSPYIAFVLLIKLMGYPAIYLLSRPMYRKHDYYFNNLGHSVNKLYLTTFAWDLFAFSILLIPFSI